MKSATNHKVEQNGIIILDKPAGISSARVVGIVKKMLGAKKVGHAGTLDPFATGVLVICLNKATKLARFFLHGNKKYEAVLHLGVETDTQDLTGKIIATRAPEAVTEKEINAVFKQFEGVIDQKPPIYSALKHKGVSLYKLARSGKPVIKPPRRIMISALKILAIEIPYIRFQVFCSAGTYVRTLCADIGTTLGCGGHLKELRRIEGSGFAVEKAISVEGLKNMHQAGKIAGVIVKMADALKGMAGYTANDVLSDKIRYGKSISAKDIPFSRTDAGNARLKDYLKITSNDNELIAVLRKTENDTRYDYCCVLI